MASDAEFEALGLLDGLDGDARQERIDLIAWLLDRGFHIDHIRASIDAPLNLPASRSTGVDLEFLQRNHCAVGLPRIEDPDAVTLLRVDGDAADAAAANDLPRLRVGVATGCAVTRAGDWFGSPVNVASRVTAAVGK
jgi:adenylate cyclase